MTFEWVSDVTFEYFIVSCIGRDCLLCLEGSLSRSRNAMPFHYHAIISIGAKNCRLQQETGKNKIYVTAVKWNLKPCNLDRNLNMHMQ